MPAVSLLRRCHGQRNSPVRNWWRYDGDALVVADLDEVLDDLPEHLVIGTGAYGQLQPDQHTVQRSRRVA
jgi:hypothetical protein